MSIDITDPHLIATELKKTIKARGWTLEGVGSLLDPTATAATLSRALSGMHRLDPRYVGQILDLVGEPREAFWKRIYEAFAGLPHPGVRDIEAASFLRRLGGEMDLSNAGVPAIVAAALAAGLPTLTRDPIRPSPKLRELDQIRLKKPNLAWRYSLTWAERCAARLTEGRLSQQTLAESLVSFGALATVLRGRGHNRAAAHVLAAALDAIDPKRSGPTWARLLWRSAPVLTDACFPRLALSHVRQASHIFSIYQLPVEEAGASLSAGIISITFFGDYRTARLCFEKGLIGASGQGDEPYTLLALVNLARLSELTGNIEQTAKYIESLETGLATDGRLATTAQWIRALAAIEQGSLEVGIVLLGGQRAAVIQFCPPIDACLHFLDYASALIRAGETRRLKTAAQIALDQLSRSSPESALLKKCYRALEKLSEGSADIAEVKRLRKRLSEPWASSQPTGSMKPP